VARRPVKMNVDEPFEKGSFLFAYDGSLL